jgi:hypothetical protein
MRGRGASCQKFAAALLRDGGFWAVEVPSAPMAHARFSRVSLVEPWLDSRPEFARILLARRPSAADPLLPGDVLGFRLGRVIHHLGVYLGKGRFIHCLEHLGTTVCPLSDPTWWGRLGAVWRPIESDSIRLNPTQSDRAQSPRERAGRGSKPVGVQPSGCRSVVAPRERAGLSLRCLRCGGHTPEAGAGWAAVALWRPAYTPTSSRR